MLVGKGKMHAKVNHPQKKKFKLLFLFIKKLKPSHI
jgi:hypothetical protein